MFIPDWNQVHAEKTKISNDSDLSIDRGWDTGVQEGGVQKSMGARGRK